ncbi:MAG: DUF1704 domain-containing protein [Candidatus Diapherotrites archaeon]|nr:DUF1704 domain-containing protein [Candidatus Diapherotrites archaeon]
MKKIREFLRKEKELFEIIDKLETDILKFVEPQNTLAQQAKFFKALKKGIAYEPIFSYLPRNQLFTYFNLTPEYASIMKRLQELKFNETGFEKLLKKKRDETIKKIELVRAIGSDAFPEKSVAYYGKPKAKLVRKAFEVLEQKPEKDNKKKFSSERVASYLQNMLNKKRIDWNIVLEENMSANAIVLPAEKAVKIKANQTYSMRGMRRLLVHEIETHVYRYINASIQPYRLLLEGASADWLETEEGLAVINEVLFKNSSDALIREYAGRVVGIHFATKHSFYETFKHMNEYFSAEKAYQLTQRVKRGCPAGKPGAFTKDYLYFKGAILVKEFLEEGGSLKELYYGKLAINELEAIKEVPVLKKPKYLPDYKKADFKAVEELPF